MNISSLSERFSGSRPDQIKAIFASLFIVQNRLQTAFDKGDPNITLKQFMLLIIVKETGGQLTFTQLGQLLGCSRQNIKKLAAPLAQKGFVTITHRRDDPRASIVCPAQGMDDYFAKVALFHGEMLGLLFEDYSDEEISHFFKLLVKLTGGIEKIELKLQEKANKTGGEK